jgi:hypothetical protein
MSHRGALKGKLMKYIVFLTFFLLQLSALEIPQSMQADFIQSVTNEHNQTITYKGSLSYVAPDKSKWIYTKPAPKTICTDANNITIIEDDLEQATLYKNQNHIDFMQLYGDAVALEDNRYVTYFQENRYFFETKEGKIYKLYYTDALNNRSQIEFSNVLYDTTFEYEGCTIPASYDVILE